MLERTKVGRGDAGRACGGDRHRTAARPRADRGVLLLPHAPSRRRRMDDRGAGCPDAGEGLARAGDDLSPGHTDHPLAVGLQELLPLGVVRASEGVVVPGGAVSL